MNIKSSILMAIVVASFPSISWSQVNVNNSQQQQNININVPIIEKKVYVDRYRTVYVDKPRVARKLDKPVLLLGYLWVFPEDLGNFRQVPAGVINSINVQKPYGRNNWRIPTPDELVVLEANAEKIGLGDEIYIATDHRNGVLRLVAVDDSYNNCMWIGDAYWSKNDLGSSSMDTPGRLVTYEEAVKFCPKGWRIPTLEDFDKLRNSGLASFGEYGGEFSFPSRTFSNDDWHGKRGQYWLKANENGELNGFHFYHLTSKWHTGGVFPTADALENDHPEKYDERCVRYIKE